MLKRGPELYRKVYLDKDRSPEEMREHKKLLSELKIRITEHGEKRWIIEDNKIVEKGLFARN